MSDFITLLQTRRSLAPHKMAGPGPTPAEIETILKIASRTPDHGKLTPWRFIVIAGEAQRRLGETIAGLYAADNANADADRLKLERERLARAPLVVGVVSRAAPHVKIPEWEQVLSAGAACTNLIWAANGLGFVATWLTEWYAYDRRFLDHLGLAPHEKIAGFVHVGRRTEPADDRPRPALADIVTTL